MGPHGAFMMLFEMRGNLITIYLNRGFKAALFLTLFQLWEGEILCYKETSSGELGYF